VLFEGLETTTDPELRIVGINAAGFLFNTNVGLSGFAPSWSLGGNNNPSNNNFGTTSNHSVGLITNSTPRGIMTNGGLLGWGTTSPTAKFHVNCAGGNSYPLSDVRFESLETGYGDEVVIDANGYLFRKGTTTTASTSWDLTGNTISPPNNYFGTNSADDIRIKTENFDRGVIQAGNPSTGGYLGWNTMNPTARLHVDCIQGNTSQSDIRFENLESGQGKILVIDDQGYVYNSGLRLNGDGTIESGGKAVNENAKKIEQLESEISALKSKLEDLLNCCTDTKTDVSTPKADGNRLYQNVPNPFGKETTIEYYIKSLQRNAFIMIYDLSGREISRHPIASAGQGKVNVGGDELISGMYIYSLVIDGEEVASKRMVFTK
jgi:hypothetical protein